MILISLCINSPCDYLVDSPISYIPYPLPPIFPRSFTAPGEGVKRGQMKVEGTARQLCKKCQ